LNTPKLSDPLWLKIEGQREQSLTPEVAADRDQNVFLDTQQPVEVRFRMNPAVRSPPALRAYASY
jgi:hypothetical protein